MRWGLCGMAFLEVLFFGIGSWFDIRKREIPISHIGIFAGLGILGNLFFKCRNVWELLLGCSIGGFFLIVGRLTKEAIGYGDGLGILVLGIYAGVRGEITSLFYAFLLSGIYAVFRMVIYKESGKNTIPFFPFLLLGTIGRLWL